MFATMKPYAPPPPPGAQPPPLWGREEHVRELFGERISELEVRRESVRVDRFETPQAFRDFFKAVYGPTIAVYNSLADNPDEVEALDRDLDDLAQRHGLDGESTTMNWEYLLVTARKQS